jgi:hypothetical protein
MNGQPDPRSPVGARRVRVARRPRRHELLPDMTLTESWPYRLNTAL